MTVKLENQNLTFSSNLNNISMTQRYLLILLLIVSSFPVLGQDLAIKLGPVFRTDDFSVVNQVIGYAPSLIIERKEKILHQVSLEAGKLTQIAFVNQNDQGETIEGRNELVYDMGLRYQVAYMFGEKSRQIRPYIGSSFEMYTRGRKSSPFVSNESNQSSLGIGSILGVVGGIRATVMEQFFIDLDLAAGVLGFGIARNSTDNPNLPIRQQTTSIIFLDGPINQIRASAAVGMYLRYQRN